MRAASLILLLTLFLSSLSSGQETSRPEKPENSQPLTIEVVKQPTWDRACLSVSIKLINRSKSRVFLDPSGFRGIAIYSAIIRGKNRAELSGNEDWHQVYGETDVIYSYSTIIRPGSAWRESHCLSKTFVVKNMMTNETRSVPLQGRLRITSQYEQNQKNGIRHEGNSYVQKYQRISLQSTIEIPIPCTTSPAEPDCSAPALIFPGERTDWMTLPQPPVL